MCEVVGSFLCVSALVCMPTREIVVNQKILKANEALPGNVPSLRDSIFPRLKTTIFFLSLLLCAWQGCYIVFSGPDTDSEKYYDKLALPMGITLNLTLL